MSEIQTANCMFWILVLSKSSVVWLLHKLKSDYTQGDLFDSGVYSREIIVLGQSSVRAYQKR